MMGSACDRTERRCAANYLGNPLRILGERGDHSALLRSITVYEAALLEFSRERAPIDWAMTQSNLGNALFAVGEREVGTARLEQAVAAHLAALQEMTRDCVPDYWAMAQNNLGNALSVLGELEIGLAKTGIGIARLQHAATAYRAALEEKTRDRLPLEWALTKTNLGNALRALGECEIGTARLEEAVAAHLAALAEFRRDRVPFQWATVQHNLGVALRSLGERELGTAGLEEAVAAESAALTEFRRDHAPLHWAMSTANQGMALILLAERLRDGTVARIAVQQLETAVVMLGDSGRTLEVKRYEAQLQKARAIIDQLSGR
jgi:tetratricopeptide (TPR) repeat protein